MTFRCRNLWMAYLEALRCCDNLTGGFTCGSRSELFRPAAAYLPSYNGIDIQSLPPLGTEHQSSAPLFEPVAANIRRRG
ncbi:hypothetical protein KY285_000352 [Solanum tuberosum]|nr:hypothetical protein KY285_000352 [Solanum tuberosum]